MSVVLLFQEAPKAGEWIKDENVYKYIALKYKVVCVRVCVCKTDAFMLLAPGIGKHSSLQVSSF